LGELTLTRLETGIGLVDDIDAALATDDLVVAVALHQTLERIADFHVNTYRAGFRTRPDE
jgi:hypothetical protein